MAGGFKISDNLSVLSLKFSLDEFRPAGVAPPMSTTEARASATRHAHVPAPGHTQGRASGQKTSVALWLFLAAVFLMPLQLEIASFKEATGTRLPPGDIFLVLSLLAAPNTLRFRRQRIALLPLAMMLMLGWGLFIALIYAGNLTNHAVTVKFLGAAVLAFWGLITISHVRSGHGQRILRMFLAGMAFWAVVSFIDWKFFDILGFLSPKTPTRFGGTQFDPNNAGAAFAVALVMHWKFGHRAFASRWLRRVIGGIFVAALYYTFSRSGYLGFAAGAAATMLFDYVRSGRWLRYALIGALIVVGMFVTGVIGDSIDEFQRRPDTIGSRDVILDDGLDFFVDSGGLGIGLGTYRAETDLIVHNTALGLLIEMSVIGLLFFFILAIVPMQEALRIRTFDRDLALAIIGGHAVMVVTSGGIEAMYQRQWWLIIGLAATPTVLKTFNRPTTDALPAAPTITAAQ